MFLPQHSITNRFNDLVELLQKGQTYEKIFVAKNIRFQLKKDLLAAAEKYQIPLSWVPDIKINKMSNLPGDGFVGLKSSLIFKDLQDIIDFNYSQALTPCFILLDGVTDVRNIGAIARTCFATKVQALILPFYHSAALNNEAIQASAGYLKQINLCRVKNINDAIELLKLNGIMVVATGAKSKVKISEINATQPIAFVIGDEHLGVKLETSKLCTHHCTIPIFNDVESYNVSVATGMILYEVMQQRNFYK